jgi:endonuclease/exonuclease/phosphatase family metal-dependent hydrolase
MIYRLEFFLRKARRWLSRNEWAVRLLRLPVSRGTATAAGLVIIQIDGLSHTQFAQALQDGKMPFLGRLLDREKYRLYRQYSGMPSNTPAVQGELFYGIRTAVPAFSFMDRASGEICRMFNPKTAAAVERALHEQGEPLLAGGSAYSDIFTGGAAESHFCPASLGWDSLLRKANPFALGFLMLSNARSFLRTAVLLVVEFLLAIVDFVRGLIDGRDLLKELKFVPTRVVICILLRELITIGAQMDVARGLPIVHLNFLGYDEQAHRRGPTSKFAHWSLKGIDDAIARIWHAAKRSARRNYDVWIYSDHGQEDAIPYAARSGRTIEQAVAEVFERLQGESHVVIADGPRGEQSRRVRLLGGKRVQRMLPVYPEATEPTSSRWATITSMGPVAMVYPHDGLAPSVRDQVAEDLVHEAKVPMVLARGGKGEVKAWTEAGEFRLPVERADLLGEDHPFLEQVAADLVDLCHHPNAGNLVLCGWTKGAQPCSFPLENGCHGGPGPEETAAFALLPGDTPLGKPGQPHLRPIDLRHAALRQLGRKERHAPSEPARGTSEDRRLRIMTYNVHGCVGMDGKLSPERIARMIAEQSPDVVALQELDVGRPRSGGIDQAQSIARYLQMEFHFHPAVSIEEELYGNAILSTLPMRLVRSGSLPKPSGIRRLEPRGALWVAVESGGTEIQIINTHLGLLPGERRAQAEALLGVDWLGSPDCRAPVVLCGDFNALPSSSVCRRLTERLRDVQTVLEKHRPKKTYFGRYPTARIDHVFIDPSIEVVDIEVPSTQAARVASDHLPLVVEMSIPPGNQRRVAP